MAKRILIFFSFFLLLGRVGSARAVTMVDTDITTDTVWSAAGNPYVIRRVWVAPGVTLALDPGVVVKFEIGASFEVEGHLAALGDISLHVVFTDLRDDVAGGDTNGDGDGSWPDSCWGEGIRIRDGGTAVFRYVEARYGGYLFLKTGAGDVSLTRSSVNDFCWDGLVFEDASGELAVTDSHLERNGAISWGSGVVLRNTGGTAEVANNFISRNGHAGVHVEGGAGTITIADNTITDNRDAGVFVGSTSPVIFRNELFDNARGIFVGGVGALPVIVGNVIQANWHGIWCENNGDPLIGGSFADRNDIAGNRQSSVRNEDPGVTIRARSNWWGSPTGPPTEEDVPNRVWPGVDWSDPAPRGAYDDDGPAVRSARPADGAVGVSTLGPITITFNEPMSPFSLNEERLSLNPGVPGRVNYDSTARTAWFKPAPQVRMENDTLYTATVSGLVTDLNGNPMGADQVFTFTTGPRTLTIVMAGEGSGTVAVDSGSLTCSGRVCQASYDSPRTVRVTAAPDPGSTLSGLGGACTGAGDCLVAVERDATLQVAFDKMLTPTTRSSFTVTADFDLGLARGVDNFPGADRLSLSSRVRPLPFIWVPNQNNTISKLDVLTGNERGRYRTVPDGVNGQPSRTTVDLLGNVWVGNRHAGTAVKVGLLEGGQCLDRDRDGTIETSRDTNGDGAIGDDEILPWGEDECVLWEVVFIQDREGTFVPGGFAGPYPDDWGTPGPRSIAVDTSNNVWIGCHGRRLFFHLDGSSGQILRRVDVSSLEHNPYGAVMDGNGVIWSASLSDHVLRLDPATDPPGLSRINLEHLSYGLAVDATGHLFVSGFDQRRLSRIDTATGRIQWTRVMPELDLGRGLAVTEDGDVWGVSTLSSWMLRLDGEGRVKAIIPTGIDPTGVSVDSEGKVWAIGLGDEEVFRFDPATNAMDLMKTIAGSQGHYGYSDMTGSIVRTVTTRTGTWTVIHDGGADDAPWGRLVWAASEPPGTSLAVRVRSSRDLAGWSEWETAVNGTELRRTPCGRYLQAEVFFQRTGATGDPALDSLDILPAVDTDPPTGSLVINGGAALTGDPRLTITLSPDDPSDVYQIVWSLDGTTWSGPSPYVREFSLELPPGDGARSVWIRLADHHCVWSAPLTDSIVLDTTPPGAPTVSGASPTADTTPLWTWTPGGGGNGQYQYKLDDDDFSSGATDTADTSWSPAAPLGDGPHTLHVRERDDAGNWSAAGSRTIRIDQSPWLTVSSPQGGEKWIWGTRHIIRWTSGNGAGAKVKIELYKGSSRARVIAASTANDGSLPWIIPRSIPVARNYKVRITAPATGVTDSSNRFFAITRK
jgi:parallel beta-helix repeat protein